MNSQEIKNTVKELMSKYNEYRAKWVAEYGNDKGFNKWFTAQVTK